MTPLDLNELRRLHATAGPDYLVSRANSNKCREFYRAVHAALPELLDELERLCAELHGTTCSGGCDVPACWTKEVER